MINAEIFANHLSEIIQITRNEEIDLFINVRTDTFLLDISNKIEETLTRIHLYEKAGSDGIFVPCIEHISEIETLVNSTELPINVMCMPNLPDFETLNKIGIKRISMGNFLFENMYQHFHLKMKEILIEKSFKQIF